MNAILRDGIREFHVRPEKLIQPLFVVEGSGIQEEISSMPGQYRYSVDELVKHVTQLVDLGVDKIMLFGIPHDKDDVGTSAYEEDGIVQRAVAAIKAQVGERVLVITDVCLCEYTSHGHCGVISGGRVDNDRTLPLLAQTALSHVRAGADIVAPSDMMDGRVGAIREALDREGFESIPIISYAVKYASAFYGPFRDAAESAPQFGDRKSYQMDPANARDAVAEAQADIAEGADMVMVKPGLAFMDVIYRVRAATDVPLLTYNVSGEYAMVKAAAANGWIDEAKIVEETLVSFFRAGCDMVVTYFAEQVAKSYAGV